MRRSIESILLALVLCLTGCGSSAPRLSNNTSTNSTATTESKTQVIFKHDYRVAASPDVITRGSGNNEGFFHISSHESGHSNLMFTDYSTAQQIFVCSSPNCAHKDESCTSYIKDEGYTVFPAVYDDKLLLVYNSLQQIGNESRPSKIEIMNTNGMDKKTLYTFDGSVVIHDGAIVGNDSIILCATKLTVNTDTIETAPCILSINVNNGECITLYETKLQDGELQKSLFIRGVSDSGFILKTITVSEYNENEDIGILTQNMEKATAHCIFELSYDGNNEQKLLTYRGGSCFEEYNGKELVYLHFKEESCSLEKIDSSNRNKEVVIEDFNVTDRIRKTDIPLTSGNFFIVGFIGDYVLINHLYKEDYDTQKNIELLYTQYAINIKTKEIVEITLSNYLMATRKPINIIAQSSDFLLVDAIEEIIDGSPYRRPGIITIENYLQSNPEYVMVDQIFEEKISS